MGSIGTRELVWLFLGFRGRLSRQPYFLAGLLLLAIQFSLLFRFMAVPEGTPESGLWAFVFMVVAILSVFSNIALTVKRLQDINRPGLLAVLYLIAGFVMWVFLCFVPGTDGPNRYGAETDRPG
jgi:uncharacterized membrane protein YhaH (DUF805 family)